MTQKCCCYSCLVRSQASKAQTRITPDSMIVVEGDADVMVKKYGNAVFLQETLWKERKLDLEMVKALLHKAPTAVHKTDAKGNLPLHLALVNAAGHEVVQALLQANPKAARMVDKPLAQGGRLPLHLAMENNAEAEVITTLLRVHPAAARMATQNHNLPLAQGGRLPLHLAMENNADAEVIATLLQAHPASARMALKAGRLPVYVAVESQAPAEVVALLLQSYPEAASVPAKNGHTTFDVWALKTACHEKHLDTAQQLLRCSTRPASQMWHEAISASALQTVCEEKFDQLDHKEEGILLAAQAALLARSMRVSLSELKLSSDEPVGRAEFVNACTHLVLHGPNLVDRRKVNKTCGIAAKKARHHALDAYSCLRCLGQAYTFVKGERSCQPTGLAVHIVAFEDLVKTLRGTNQGVGHVGLDVRRFEAEVQRVEHTAEMQRAELVTMQKDIQGLVAGCVEGACMLQLQGVASLDSLPEEVQNKIQNRNLKRANHAKDLRSALEDLLQATLVEATKTKSEQDREKHLEHVLAAACSSVQAYNIAHAASGAECDRMGAQWPSSMPEEGEKIPSVLRMHDNWRESHLENKHAERSDAAVIALQEKFADAASVRKVLGVEKAEAQKDTGFEEALEAAGSAIAEERENQSKDALGFFPCTALLHAGRQLLETWKTESAAIRKAVQVCGMLEEDLKQHELCLGLLSKNKETFVAELLAARALHDEKVLVLETLTPVITKGNASMIRKVAQGFELQDVPADQLMSNLLNDVKGASGGLTAAMMKLTGEIQPHFPEVILLVAKGLPPELGLLWRPTQSPESFDEKELVASETRHTFVWRVRDGETWFAIKEYPIRQASDLRTCFREAAMVYRHRHLNIVEIKAVFLGTGHTSTSFYMQMPWYKHGSVDNWVCGDQRPGWVKVRSVLLDALLGLAHLHENGILHCDVKPPNILVDDRERGRLADFDLSIDTKESTLRGSMTTTICATALGMSSEFAAPELQSSRQATKHTDMFAYGKTMLCLQGHCEPGAVADHDKARGQTAALVSNLTSEDPQSRPAANHAIVNDFFSILNDVRIRDSKVCLLCDMNGDDGKKDTGAGIECSEGHFHCGSCVVILVQDFLKVENKGKHAWMKGEVKCFKCPTECNAPGFKERDLVRHLSVDDFQAYLNGKLEILEADLKAQLEERSRKQVEEEVARLKALDERERRVLLARKHIEEEIMQLKCPRQGCRRAFFDFEGCFALSCSACTCKFCGWCLQDCGDHDAHPHVLQCAQVPGGVDALFPQMPTVPLAFEKIHKERCRERTMSYINNEVETDIRKKVRQLVKRITKP